MPFSQATIQQLRLTCKQTIATQCAEDQGKDNQGEKWAQREGLFNPPQKEVGG